MGLNELFYSIAIFFIIVFIWYFLVEYLAELAVIIKVILSFVSAVFLFILADYLRRRNI